MSIFFYLVLDHSCESFGYGLLFKGVFYGGGGLKAMSYGYHHILVNPL